MQADMKPQVPERLLSLDIFRGVTIAAMILVNNLAYWSDSFRVLRLTHAQWNGCNFADLIFPFFIFIVGVSSDFSQEKRANTEETLAQVPAYPGAHRGPLFPGVAHRQRSHLRLGFSRSSAHPQRPKRASGRSFSPRLPGPRSTSFPWPTCEFRGCCNALPWFICRCRLF